MPRVAHRIAPNRTRELRERAWARAEQRLAGRVICARCKSNVKNYADRCEANPDEKCPGATAWAETYATALREVGL